MLAAVPLAVILAVLAHGTVGRRLGIGRLPAFLLVLGVAGVIAITLIPQAGGPPAPADATCLIPSLSLPAQGRLFTFNDESLNVALFVPLGFAVGLMADNRRVVPVAAFAIGLPWVVEAIQLLIPRLGRWCQSEDLTANLLGLFFGVAAAFLVDLVRTEARGRLPRR